MLLQRAGDMPGAGLGDGVRRQQQEVDACRQFFGAEQGADLPQHGQQHLPRGGQEDQRS